MRYSLLRSSNTGAGIKQAVYLLPVQAMLIGVFYGYFDITAHSMFLSLFSEKIMARAYILSGLAGLILSFLFAFLYKKIPFRKLALINLLFIAIVTLILWIILIINPSAPVIFILFIMMGPLNILAMLGMDRSVLRTERKEQRGDLSGFTGTAMIAGIMAACFSVPVLTGISEDLRYFILLSFIAVTGAAVIQSYAGKDHAGEDHDLKVHKKVRGFLIVRENRLYRWLVAVTILSVISSFFIQYTFLAVSRLHYPSMQDLAHFLGLFTGIIMAFALIIRYFLFPFIIRNFRLPAAIIISPLIIIFLTVATLITGYSNGYGNTAPLITGFFILLAMSRLFSRSFKESVELSAHEVIQQSLDENLRFSAVAVIRGPVNESGTIIAGMILTAMGIIGSVDLIHFPVVLLILTLLWMLAAYRLYSVYRASVSANEGKPVKSDPDEADENINPVWENRISAEMAFTADFYKIISGDPGITEKIHNKRYLTRVLDYAGIKKDISFLPVLKKIRSGSGISKEIKQRASEIIQDLELLLSGVRNRDERLQAMILFSEDRPPHIPEVLKLLRNEDVDLKIIALNVIRKFRLSELLPDVCACLADSCLAVHAENTLKSFGSEADQPLRRLYLLYPDETRVSTAIIKILGENCSGENTDFLFSLLLTASRPIREAVLNSLAGCNYNISPDEKVKLLRVINEVIGVITWNMAAGLCLRRNKSRISGDALLQENRRWMNFLFNLIAVTYGNRVAEEIRKNITEGSSGSFSHALEIINIITDEQVKSRLTVLFDRIPDRQKLRTLFRFYPGEIPEWSNLVGYLINRDYNLLGVWIRACILREIPVITGIDLTESLIALLFSPEKILREETAKLLSRSGKEYFTQAYDRLPAETRDTLDNIIRGNVKDHELLYDKVIFLKSFFQNIPEECLLALAGNMKSAGFLTPEHLPREKGYLLWECNSGMHDCKAGVFYDNILRKISNAGADSFCYILPLADIENYLVRYPEHTPEIFKYIDETERRTQYV